MRINNHPVAGVYKAYDQQKKLERMEPSQGTKKDDINLSAEARLVGAAMQALRELPETSPKKLAELQEDIQRGTYQVNGEAVAEKIWQEMGLNKLV